MAGPGALGGVTLGEVAQFVAEGRREFGLIIEHGKKVNPGSVKVPSGTILGGRELAAFKAEKGRIDSLIARQGGKTSAVALRASEPGGPERFLR